MTTVSETNGALPDMLAALRQFDELGYQPWAGRVASKAPAVPFYVASGAIGPLGADGTPFAP